MHVLIATTGALDPVPVVDFTRHLLGTDGTVTVTTVIEVPHDFLENLDADAWNPLPGESADVAERIAHYLDERGRRSTEPIVQALRAAGIPCAVRHVEGSDAVTAISAVAEELDADVVILGATRPIFAREAWESVSARIMLDSRRPVLVVPSPRKGTEEGPADR